MLNFILGALVAMLTSLVGISLWLRTKFSGSKIKQAADDAIRELHHIDHMMEAKVYPIKR
ncbi:hypothetical protein WJT86_00180 [Microvirga sp. W0021]|uniref:Uncharacterized protein n=1 Tax=Hohaiivirga grylli TaxID=3133970 RepID=A0ABV0BER7_9HYPH